MGSEMCIRDSLKALFKASSIGISSKAQLKSNKEKSTIHTRASENSQLERVFDL